MPSIVEIIIVVNTSANFFCDSAMCSHVVVFIILYMWVKLCVQNVHDEIFIKKRALSWCFVDFPHKYMSLRGAIVMRTFEGSVEEKCNVLWFVC